MSRPRGLPALVLSLGLLTASMAAMPLRAQGRGPGGPGGSGGGYTITVRPATISLATPGTPEFNRGYAAQAGIELEIGRSGRGRGRGGPPWALEVRADDSTLGGQGKPVSDIRFRDSNGGWTPLTTSFQTLARGRGSTTVTTELRLRLAYGRDVPDLYGTGLTFRVSRR